MGYFYNFIIIWRKWISAKVESGESGFRRKWNPAKVESCESGIRRKWKFEFPLGEIPLVESRIRRKWMNPFENFQNSSLSSYPSKKLKKILAGGI